jgi:hypothetical protein
MARPFHPLTEHLVPVAELPVPWYVAGGWAIDLFVERVTRDHQDVDLVIARDDQRAAFDHLPDRAWMKIVPHPEGLTGRGTIEPWDGEPLSLPVHQILVDGEDDRIEFLLSEIDGGLWRSRRNLEVAMPVETMGRTTVDGIRYITPEIVLLYKAKHLRDWDGADFATALPEMTLAQRHWLFHALEAQHPGHPWTARLGVS